MKFWGDTETFSELNIKVGTYRYVESCELMIVTWAVDDGPVQLWDRTENPEWPDDLLEALIEADEFSFHNSMFDRLVLNKHSKGILAPFPQEKIRDTMVKALSVAMPGSLDKLCEILGVEQDKAKLKVGAELVQFFCKPRPKNSKLRRATRLTHPEKWAEFLEYARHDILAMREVDKLLPNWNYRDQELASWFLDQKINDRGFAVDLDLVRAALAAADSAKAQLAEQTCELTHGALESTTQRDALLAHVLAEYGVTLPDMRSSTLQKLLATSRFPDELRELLEIRLQACITSPSKYTAFLKGVSADGRMRGTLQFDGASRTTRWSGKTVQPQNFPRPKYEAEEIEEGIELLKAGRLAEKYTNIMQFVGSATRGCIVAPKGKKLVVADLSNIEGRIQAWFANEEWKLQAFRDFDAGKGPDLYNLAYARAFDIDPAQVTKDQRKIGKVMELGMGYEGGVGAFLKFAMGYDLDLYAMSEIVLPTLPEAIRYKSESYFDHLKEEGKSTYGLTREVFVACDSLKRLWRDRHSKISSLWPELKNTVILALQTPNEVFPCRHYRICYMDDWLLIKLPSGRYLCYYQPQIHGENLSYMGVHQFTHQWRRIYTYGGKFFENSCQALACHLMKDNMPAIEAAGYELVLTVHDEVVCETPDSPEFNAPHLSKLLATNPIWLPDMPLAAAGFESYRYRKD